MEGPRNLVVLQSSGLQLHRQLYPGDPRYTQLSAAYNKAVDAFESERGRSAVRTYILAFLQTTKPHAHGGLAEAARLAAEFIQKLNTSPMLLDDDHLSPVQTVSLHPRGEWHGSYEDFNIRGQAIKMNSVSITLAVDRYAAYEADRNNQNATIYQLSLFRLYHAYIHELGHLLQTFVGNGGPFTPPHLSAGIHSRSQDARKGEAGEFIEMALFHGVIDFFRDDSELGSQDGGFPWMSPQSLTSGVRLDMRTVSDFVGPDWTPGQEPFVLPDQSNRYRKLGPPMYRGTAELPRALEAPSGTAGVIKIDYRGSNHDPRQLRQVCPVFAKVGLVDRREALC